MKVTVIAEAGVNHNGDLTLAKKLVDVAKIAGADFVKFQTFDPDALVIQQVGKAEYQKTSHDDDESQYEMLRKLQLTDKMHRELIDYSLAVGIRFLSTAFDMESAHMLYGLGQRAFKIPSGEITNTPLVRFIGSIAEQVILSTGMSTLEEVRRALNEIERAGTSKNRVTVLHCTSAYPTPYSEVNLAAMVTLRDELGVKVGYSDHTMGTEVPIAAVAMGASIIEKHFTIDRNLVGPDHKASLNPDELQSMVRQIRNIEVAVGDGKKQPSRAELDNLLLVRKSIVARTAIAQGEVFSESNLTTKRPGTGLSPIHWDRIIGSIAHRNFCANELIDEA